METGTLEETCDMTSLKTLEGSRYLKLLMRSQYIMSLKEPKNNYKFVDNISMNNIDIIF